MIALCEDSIHKHSWHNYSCGKGPDSQEDNRVDVATGKSHFPLCVGRSCLAVQYLGQYGLWLRTVVLSLRNKRNVLHRPVLSAFGGALSRLRCLCVLLQEILRLVLSVSRSALGESSHDSCASIRACTHFVSAFWSRPFGPPFVKGSVVYEDMCRRNLLPYCSCNKVLDSLLANCDSLTSGRGWHHLGDAYRHSWERYAYDHRHLYGQLLGTPTFFHHNKYRRLHHKQQEPLGVVGHGTLRPMPFALLNIYHPVFACSSSAEQESPLALSHIETLQRQVSWHDKPDQSHIDYSAPVVEPDIHHGTHFSVDSCGYYTISREGV